MHILNVCDPTWGRIILLWGCPTLPAPPSWVGLISTNSPTFEVDQKPPPFSSSENSKCLIFVNKKSASEMLVALLIFSTTCMDGLGWLRWRSLNASLLRAIWGTTSRQLCLYRPSSVRRRGWKFDQKQATSQIHLLNLLKHLPRGHGWHLTDVRNFARRQIAQRPIACTDHARRANPTHCFDYAKSNPHEDKLIFWQLGNGIFWQQLSCQFLATFIIDLEIFHRLFEVLRKDMHVYLLCFCSSLSTTKKLFCQGKTRHPQTKNLWLIWFPSWLWSEEGCGGFLSEAPQVTLPHLTPHLLSIFESGDFT